MYDQAADMRPGLRSRIRAAQDAYLHEFEKPFMLLRLLRIMGNISIWADAKKSTRDITVRPYEGR